jgi:serine/threonine protein kinase
LLPIKSLAGEQLGQGGFADVHAAELVDPLLPSFSESVAVKRLRPDVLKSPDDLREFLTEANLLRKLQHRWENVGVRVAVVVLGRGAAVQDAWLIRRRGCVRLTASSPDGY